MADLRFVATLLVTIPLAYVTGWNYDICGNSDGPSTWASEYSQCGGSKQSPISLGRDTSESTFLGYYMNRGVDSGGPLTLTATNTGYGVRIDGISNGAAFIGAGLPGADVHPDDIYEFDEVDNYLIDHLMIHWGSKNGQGSEHVLNGEQGEGELQVVTYNNKYASLEEARANEDGVHIIAYVIKVEGDDYPGYVTLVDAVQHIDYKGQSHEFTIPVLSYLVKLGYLNWYHRYRGSFTTPPCEETVIWSVVDEPLKMSQAQMDAFRNLYANEANAATNCKLADNYRPPRDLDGRKVQYSDFVSNASY